MSDKFTPGPWLIVPETLGSIEAVDGQPIGQASQTRPMYLDQLQVERMANARLMAAAPELLKALRFAYRHLNGGWDSLTPKEHAEAFQLSRAAILKATGEPS